MPIVRKIRTVVTSYDTPTTEYVVVSVAQPTSRNGKGNNTKKMGIQPVKYFYKNTQKQLINTHNTLLNEEEFNDFFKLKYNVELEDFDVTRMYRGENYNLYLVLIIDFETTISEFKASISWELYDFKTSLEKGQDQEVFQSVIEKHRTVGRDFKKNYWCNSTGKTKMKPLKLWKTLTGYCFN
jgi:hypothetical protein